MCESYELSLTCISPSYVTHTYEILRITKQPLSWSVYKSQIQGYYHHEKVMSGDEEFPLSLLSLFLSSLSLPSQTQQTNKRKTNKKTARRIWLGFLRICRAFCVFEFCDIGIKLQEMISDSITNASASAAPSARDMGKKKRVIIVLINSLIHFSQFDSFLWGWFLIALGRSRRTGRRNWNRAS